MMQRIKIVVADENPIFREGLCRLLEDENDLEAVGTAADGEEVVRLARQVLPDVAIIDVAMPRVNGIEAATHIKAACPGTAILMMSAYRHESYMLSSLRAGATGYLLKNVSLRDLVNAIRLVHAGEGVFDLKVASKMLSRAAGDKGEGRRNLKGLRHRELEVLRLVAKGLGNKEIAAELVVSERTVQTHLVNIFRKLRVPSRTAAVFSALNEGWLTLDELPPKEER
jgi:NarL family two-component system response regulator LiaR